MPEPKTGRSEFDRTRQSEADKWLEENLATPDEVAGQNLRVLLYGRPGVGKTTFCATAVPPILLVNAEQPGGVIPISGRGVKIVQVQQYRDILLVLKMLKGMDHGYRTVCVDGLTELQKKGMDAILADSKRDLPSMQDWQRSIEDMRWLCRSLTSLPINLIVTAQGKEEADQEDGRLMMRLDLPGKLPGALPAYFDAMFYMGVKQAETQTEAKDPGQVERYLRVQPHPKVDAKFRVPPEKEHLFSTFEDPDFAAIHARLFGESDASGQTPESEENADGKREVDPAGDPEQGKRPQGNML